MLKQNKLPMGLLLQQAGLISAEQLQEALKLQAKYTQLKLGEILALQQGIKVKTIDFFVDKWQETIEQGQIFPLGYYLQKAYLLNQQQIKVILQEQKNNQQKFGILAVQKGWIKQDTINFFLDNLYFKFPQIMSLDTLEEYNQEELHLELKYFDHTLILSRILAWTGGISYLTKIIAQVFAKSDFNIPQGQEIKTVDRFIKVTLIRKWQTSKSAGLIRAINQSLLHNFRCDSSLLLQEYGDILSLGSKKYQGNKEQKELLLLGLIIQENKQVKVSNLIYQHVFNREFIDRELEKKQLKTSKTINTNTSKPVKSTGSIIEYNSQIPLKKSVFRSTQTDPKVKPNSVPKQRLTIPASLTNRSSFTAFVAIALLIPLFLTLNNYLSPSKVDKVTTNSMWKANQLEQFCRELDFADSQSLSFLSLIAKLETNQQHLLNDFPANCNITLNQLRLLAAPQLGKDNRILEAIRHLCKVPADSEMYIDAEIWLKRWYDSASWGRETKLYIEEIKRHHNQSCPAAHFTEYKS
jgi:hypothetical protein